MSIILFGIIGKTINANGAYWFCFGIYAVCRVVRIIYEVSELCN